MSRTPSTPKKTKIVATLGPASGTPAIIERMAGTGVNVFRINMSHTKPDQFAAMARAIRDVGERLNAPLAVMADLRGPRIRIGEVTGGSIDLRTGQTVVLTPEVIVGTPQRISISFPRLAHDLAVGTELLIDDGNIRLEVVELQPSGDIIGRVLRGGTVSDHRGINIPGRHVSLPALTEKDLADVALGVEEGADFFALSFAQSPADVRHLKDVITARGGHQKVIAKIERESAVRHIESIAREAHGIMIARGDLALEMSIEETPIAQKHIMTVCRSLDRPVITATQMLESMTRSARPTRAEAADVANAILDGTDALMLSGETAIGVDPVNVVATMARIARRIEHAIADGQLRPPAEVPSPQTPLEALASASRAVAEEVGAALILVYTSTGGGAVRISSQRPKPLILALCPNEMVRRRLSLVWGVEARLVDIEQASDHPLEVATREAVRSGLARSGDRTVLTTGSVFADRGVADFLKIDQIP